MKTYELKTLIEDKLENATLADVLTYTSIFTKVDEIRIDDESSNFIFSIDFNGETYYIKVYVVYDSWSDDGVVYYNDYTIVEPYDVIVVQYQDVEDDKVPYVIVLENDVVLEFDSEKDMLACVKTLKKSKTVLKYLRLYDYEKVTNGN